MFEKEAEEYARQNNPAEYGVKATHFTVLNSFKDGAEFGYNKAKEDADKMKSRFLELCNLKDMRIAELEKANEWHYTKYELPPEDVPLLCMRGGNIYVAWFILGKWKGDKYNDVKKPYAWKEIVLPKESE